MKILILRFSSIGDIVLTSPVMRCIKKQLPDAEIHYCTKEKFKSLVEPNIHVDKVHYLTDSLPDLIKELKHENFDIVLDLHNNLRTARIKMALRAAKIYTFKKLNVKKWLFVKLGLNLMPSVHIVHRYLDTCKSLGVKYDGLGLDYFFPENSEIPSSALALLPTTPFIAYAIGGTYTTKKLPVHKMHELFKLSPLPIVLLGDQTDNATISGHLAGFEGKVVNLCGQLSLAQSAKVLEKASQVLAHDTGMMHIAAALKKPVISIWGNTVPQFGMSPLFPDSFAESFSFISEVKNLSCRPCSKLGYSTCPKGHFNCMNQQKINEIIEALNKDVTPVQ